MRAESGRPPQCGWRKAAKMLLVLGVLLGLAGCRSFNVQHDWDPGVDFERFGRFHWVEPPEIDGADPFADNSLLRKRVRDAVETVLEGRGFRPVATIEEADFLITFAVLLEDRLRVDSVSSGLGYGYFHRRAGFGTLYGTSNVRNYQESTLVLDVLDPQSEELVWRGWGTGIVGTRDRDRQGKRMEEGVRAILERFPPID